MRNRTITCALLIISLLLFLCYFVLLNTIQPPGNVIVKYLNDIITYAQQDNWQDAEESFNLLASAWERKKYLIFLNYAEADYSIFIENLSGIQGAIKTRDNYETISQALCAINLLNNFIKVVPEP